MTNLELIIEFVTSYNKGEFSIRYGNAMSLANAEELIAKYICDNYPEKGFGQKGNILGRPENNFTKTAWTKIDKLSKNDETLQELVEYFVGCIKYVER